MPKLTKKSCIVELFAGSGTLSFPLAQHARLEAYEGHAAAVAAQDKAIRTQSLAGRMSIALRDLHRRRCSRPTWPAAPPLDPPFAGAAAQMRFLIAANVPRVIYVAAIPRRWPPTRPAARAGYTVLNATPIDQFPFSENVESVVVFGKGK